MLWKPGCEVVHLVGEDISTGKDKPLEPAWLIWNVDQWHSGFFWGATAFGHIAGAVSGDHVGPDIEAAFGSRDDMIAGSLISFCDDVGAIGANIPVSCEQ